MNNTKTRFDKALAASQIYIGDYFVLFAFYYICLSLIGSISRVFTPTALEVPEENQYPVQIITNSLKMILTSYLLKIPKILLLEFVLDGGPAENRATINEAKEVEYRSVLANCKKLWPIPLDNAVHAFGLTAMLPQYTATATGLAASCALTKVLAKAVEEQIVPSVSEYSGRAREYSNRLRHTFAE